MKFEEVFGEAEWIAPSDSECCPIIKREFEVSALSSIDEASIDIIGFAAFSFYLNGTRGSEDYFLPLASDYEYRGVPTGEVTAHRCYVSHYDITKLLRSGKNCLTVLLGDGWYTGHTGKYAEVPYGKKKLCFRITIRCGGKEHYIHSDKEALWKESFVKESDLNFGEEHNYSGYSIGMLSGEGEGWLPVVTATAPETEYCFTDCPRDRVVEQITPKRIGEIGGGVIYDVGKNITGFPTLYAGGRVAKNEVLYSEALGDDGDLLAKCMHSQRVIYREVEKGQTLEPQFTWFGFRFFKVIGDAEVITVKRINCDIAVTSDFECDDENLNWLYRAFLLTQLSNMHQGIPSDCPHIERRGYLGDGHLTCDAAMTMLDARSFYRKWITDISDCQDRISGHAQYTAPYTHSGGGPGGFAHGFIKIPYQYYLHYGDKEPLELMYEQFFEYLRYLEEHSEYDLVVSDKKGEWCLGEWCVPAEPTGDMLSSSAAKPGGSFLPPAYVNTVYYVKSLELLIKIARLLGRAEDVPKLEERIARKKTVIKAAYFNPNNGTFVGNMQGANAFALDIGLGDERTKEAFIRYYEQNPYFDTGIFGTETVSRLLCEYGRADLVIKMIGATEPRGFGRWREMGATTLFEYWDAPRSMSHPMFGSVTACLFNTVLGIRQEEDNASSGFSRLTVAPDLRAPLRFARGYITLPTGKLSVAYEKQNDSVKLSVDAPSGTEVTLKIRDKEYLIHGASHLEAEASEESAS